MTKPIYALVGADNFLQLQSLAEILKGMPEGTQRVDVDGERAELAEVFDELRSYSMFGSGKLVVVREADAFLSRYREQLEDYVAKPSDSSTLVLRLNSLPSNQRIYKAIAKVGDVIQCNPPKDLKKWITERARAQHKIALAPDAAAMLLDMVGDDLGRLDMELSKLALQTDGKVGSSDITTGVAFQREQEMYDMTNQVAIGNTPEALRRWRQLIALDPSAEFRAVTWLAMWLEDVGIVLSGSQAAMSKLTWKYKDRLKQFTDTAKSLGRERHARAYDLLAEIDKQSKSGVGNAADNVERFLLSLSA